MDRYDVILRKRRNQPRVDDGPPSRRLRKAPASSASAITPPHVCPQAAASGEAAATDEGPPYGGRGHPWIDMMSYASPRKQPRVDNKQGRSDESGNSHARSLLATRDSWKVSALVQISREVAAQVPLAWMSLMQDAGGKLSVPSASHDATAAATRQGRCSSADDDNLNSIKAAEAEPDGREEAANLVLPHGRARRPQELHELGESVRSFDDE